ncbi:hypothetical protein BTH42_04745 [Burkholderia sp. SRS-W-2-2016]|uniref:hypothetical protein n=1 Tax=Burkholderia sp. SRS-W-2-2016 TaxID=1926878 RepID=UPI00094AF080|nr:hypothetical protein [Burkholderia sp. SRS-W-2-2016]OLL32894.1 hypothetical protein BTH42_04745 [Burkholderia sp. SRS-W-2-2016]
MPRHLAALTAALPSTLFSTLLLAASAAPAQPLELASIAVSLTVQESCVVKSADTAISVINQPVVSCVHGAPFQIDQAGVEPTADQGSSQPPQPSPPLAFATTHGVGDAQQTVWTVSF